MSLISQYLNPSQQELLAEVLQYTYANPIEDKAQNIIDQLHEEQRARMPQTRVLLVKLKSRPTRRNPKNCTLEISLTGDWLHDAGFTPNNNARIFPLDGMLVICPEEKLKNIKNY